MIIHKSYITILIFISLIELMNQTYIIVRLIYINLKMVPQHILFRGFAHGMYAQYVILLGMLHLYETGQYTGVNVDMKPGLLYTDPTINSNWWLNYFEPIKVGDVTTPPKQYLDTEFIGPFLISEKTLTRAQNNDLIEKYIHLNPKMTQVLGNFTEKHFGDTDYIIGVHYRGLEKKIDAVILPFENYSDKVKGIIQGLGPEVKYKIFVATDVYGFLEHMKAVFGDRIVSYNKSCRSKDGNPHYKNWGPGYSTTPCEWATPYYFGESAVMDCYVLALTDILIRSDSNLSLTSTFINPDLNVIKMTHRFASQSNGN